MDCVKYERVFSGSEQSRSLDSDCEGPAPGPVWLEYDGHLICKHCLIQEYIVLNALKLKLGKVVLRHCCQEGVGGLAAETALRHWPLYKIKPKVHMMMHLVFLRLCQFGMCSAILSAALCFQELHAQPRRDLELQCLNNQPLLLNVQSILPLPGILFTC